MDGSDLRSDLTGLLGGMGYVDALPLVRTMRDQYGCTAEDVTAALSNLGASYERVPAFKYRVRLAA
jgi:hypothetical protein